MKLKQLISEGAHYGWAFFCPACDEPHQVPTTGPHAWAFNKNLESPTFHPSVKVTFHDGRVCHSNIIDGVIHYDGDCSHERRSTSVPLGEYPSNW